MSDTQRGASAEGPRGERGPATDGASRLAEEYIDRADPAGETERHRLEAEFWRTLFDGLVADLPESALVVDGGGRITHWNRAHEEMVGIAEEEAVGNNAHEVLGTEGAEETLAEEVARVGETIAEDDVRVIPGSDKALQVYAVPLRAPDGRSAGAFSVAADVTDHVRRQRDLERLQARVSGEVHARTEELAEAVDEVAAFTDDADRFAAEQADRMREVADEMTEQSATVQEIAASAEQVNAASDRTRALVDDGDDAATGANEAMDGVDEATDDQAASAEEVAAMVETAVEEIETLEGRLDAVAETAADGRQRVREVEASVEELRAE